MQCPICDVTLVMADRQGIEIDYCPQCRGVWLDRGELDKLIERSAREAPARPAPAPAPPEAYREGAHGGERRYGKHKKPKSLLGELFDF